MLCGRVLIVVVYKVLASGLTRHATIYQSQCRISQPMFFPVICHCSRGKMRYSKAARCSHVYVVSSMRVFGGNEQTPAPPMSEELDQEADKTGKPSATAFGTGREAERDDE